MEKLIWKNLLEKRAKWLFFGKKIANFEILKIFENLIDRAGAPLGQGTNRQIDRLVIERIIQDVSFGSVHIYWSINPNIPIYVYNKLYKICFRPSSNRAWLGLKVVFLPKLGLKSSGNDNTPLNHQRSQQLNNVSWVRRGNTAPPGVRVLPVVWAHRKVQVARLYGTCGALASGNSVCPFGYCTYIQEERTISRCLMHHVRVTINLWSSC